MGCHDHRHRSRTPEKESKYSSSGRDSKHSKKDHYKDDRKDYRTDRRDRDRDRDRGKDRRRDRRDKKEYSSKSRRKDDRRRSRSRSRDRSRRDHRDEKKRSHRRRSYSRSKSPETRSSRSPSNPKPSKVLEVENPPTKPAPVKAFDFSALVESKPVVCPKQQPNLPTYYNPSVINSQKYTEQIQKRKLLWGNKSAEQSSSQWNSAKFSQDTDGKVQSKFLRLMGVKNVDPTKIEATTATTSKDDQIKNREDMFSNMQQQYDVARQTTHTMRGYGLGFSSQSRQL